MKFRLLSSSAILSVLFAHVLLTSLSSCGELSKLTDINEIGDLYTEGRILEAKTAAIQYLEKKPGNELAWTILGNIHTDLDEDSLAKNAFNKALDLNPKTEEAMTGLGILARKEGDYKKAATCYKKAIEINPGYGQAHSSLSVIYLKMESFPEAVEAGEKAYQLDKTDPAIAANLAVAYHYNEDSLERDRFFKVAEMNGYQNLETLQEIFDGELTILD